MEDEKLIKKEILSLCRSIVRTQSTVHDYLRKRNTVKKGYNHEMFDAGDVIIRSNFYDGINNCNLVYDVKRDVEIYENSSALGGGIGVNVKPPGMKPITELCFIGEKLEYWESSIPVSLYEILDTLIEIDAENKFYDIAYEFNL